MKILKFLLTASILHVSSLHCNINSDSVWISKLKSYLKNDLNSFGSDFDQIDSSGNVSKGKLFLRANQGEMKLKYFPPNPNVLIVKNFKMTVYNRDLKEKTAISVYSSPFASLLDKNLDFDKNVKVLSVNEKDEFVGIKLCKNDDETEGSVLLIFSRNPFRLLRWVVFDQRHDDYSRRTVITLKNPNYKANLSSKVFESFS